MTRAQRKVQRKLLAEEKRMLDDLRKVYTRMLATTRQKLRYQMMRTPTEATAQTIAHRIGYQQAMERQLMVIMEALESDTITLVSEYLSKVYDRAFYGANYSMNMQGIPVSLGIDEAKVARAVMQRVEGYKFSERIHGDVRKLSETVRMEVASGIAGGETFGEIAQAITFETDMNLKRAYRIARTEGTRVIGEARQDAFEQAVARGADIVKEWSALLDSKTRSDHGRLDGQIVDVDKPFTINGMEAMHPGGFGVAGMDINCRCVVLERSRAAVEYERAHGRGGTRIDGETGQKIPYQTYDEWRAEKGLPT